MREIIKVVKGKLVAKYLKDDSIKNYSKRAKKFKQRINTKYVCYSGDDDYFIINGLEKAIDKLKNSKNVIGANGKSLTFGLAGKKYNKSLSFGVYKNFSSNYKKSNIKKRNGTDIKPPPIPKSPAKKPTGTAAMTIKIIK